MISEAVLVALIGLGGSCVGSIFGVVCSAKLTNYRLEQLEKKVDRHNDLIEKMFKVEQEQAVVSSKISGIDHRLETLETNLRRDAMS
ncbi:MAG: hypothetical protein E7525_01555 [Ruminococcaceae bacterium]|nr:hypothetical protein [Oscillospiraceae bacterium]